MSLKPKTNDVAGKCESARRYADQIAAEVINDERCEGVRQEIIRLFTEERQTSLQIAERVNGSLELNDGVKITTAASIIRRVIAKTVNPAIAQEIRSANRANQINGYRKEISEARDAALEAEGKFVWTEEETFAIKRMMNNERYLLPEDRMTKKRLRIRARQCDYEKMLEALVDLFPGRNFTKKIIARKVDYERTVIKKRKQALERQS